MTDEMLEIQFWMDLYGAQSRCWYILLKIDWAQKSFRTCPPRRRSLSTRTRHRHSAGQDR